MSSEVTGTERLMWVRTKELQVARTVSVIFLEGTGRVTASRAANKKPLPPDVGEELPWTSWWMSPLHLQHD